MSLQSDMIKVQIFVANRKLNALEKFVFKGSREQWEVQAGCGMVQAWLLQAELAGLEQLLEGTNLGDLLEDE